MLRKMLACLGASFVLTVIYILYAERIPANRSDANEVFENVARELTATQEGASRRTVVEQQGRNHESHE
jgi:hypothetical protein